MSCPSSHHQRRTEWEGWGMTWEEAIMLTTAGRLAPRCYFTVWEAECSPVEEDVAEQLFCNYGAKTGGTGIERVRVWLQRKRRRGRCHQNYYWDHYPNF